MTGFQIFLCVLLGIVLFFVLILSIPVHVSLNYSDKIYLSVRYLFIKLKILPVGEKKEKPEKEKPPKKPKEKPPKDDKPKEKKPNPLLEMVKANGYDGMMEILANLKHVFGLYGGKLLKSVVFDKIEIYITVGTGDSASTAIKYGKTCQKVYPLVSFLCNNNVVKKYGVNISPDFLANRSVGEFEFDFHIVLRKIINASIAMVVRLVFKVVLKFLMGAKKNKTAEAENTNPKPQPQNAN
ncbi:MAG: DUF2953 domain-containing protein [Clostridia bacterium]|nr:DUF2953 domain-containing protein [Clostridia bacterium]